MIIAKHLQDASVVEIRCDGNREVGFGHLRRSLTLAEALKPYMQVQVIGLSEDASRMIGGGYEKVHDARIVILDSPYSIADQLQELKQSGTTTVALDWFGAELADINIVVYPHHEVRALQAAYTGFEYILIRDEITSLKRKHAPVTSNQVLICFGGADLLQQGHSTAVFLRDLGFDVTLVQGPFATDLSEGKGYKVLVNPPDFPTLLAKSDWVVSNGGGCLFETFCLGKAAYVLPQTEAELKIAVYAEERGAVLGIGIENLRRFNVEELSTPAAQGMQLVDGEETG
jgi:spore coat polysaccharide biosynthesis predicted glycosyltransferase SpsG